MALDPDTDSSDDTSVEGDDVQPEVDGPLPQFSDGLNNDFAAVEPDVAEAESLGGLLTAAETREIVCIGRALPIGWRRDDDGNDGLIRRSVWTHP